MKIPVLLLALMLCGQSVRGQRAGAAPDSVLVASHFGSDNREMNQLMSQVMHIEKLHFEVHSASQRAKRFHLTFQEYRNGVPGPETELVGNVERLTSFDRQGNFVMDVFARQASDTKLLNQFFFISGATEKTFAALPGAVGQYSLRQDIWPYKKRKTLAPLPADAQPTVERYFPVGRKVSFLVYTVPYEDKQSGYLLYCDLAQSKVPIPDWYKQFSIGHFVVYSVVIE